jgi:hypothetical protein
LVNSAQFKNIKQIYLRIIKMKTMILLLNLFTAYSAFAAPTHLFWCGLLDSEPAKQVYFEIEDSAVRSQIGNIQISNMGPQGWKLTEEAQVKAKITWGLSDGRLTIRGIQVDMGRSGQLKAHAVGPYSDGYTKGFVQSNLMNFNFPNGANTSYCTYFHSLGPKPAMTGSN